MRTFLTSRRNDIKPQTRKTFLELESCASSVVSVDGACHTVMEHEDHRVLEVSSAMVTHSLLSPQRPLQNVSQILLPGDS
ncbi:hypothetical protein ACRRTK_015806 [Alexandromys fortis]